MALKIILLLLAAALTWWVTRPLTKRRGVPDKRQLTKCGKCGVYYEEGGTCQCQEKDA